MNTLKQKQQSSKGRKFTAQSLTIPGQTYTIQELFERALFNNLPEELNRVSHFDDEQGTATITELLAHEGTDFTLLDEIEQFEYQEQLREYISNMKDDIDNKIREHKKLRPETQKHAEEKQALNDM